MNGFIQVVVDDSTAKVVTGVHQYDRDNGGTLIVPAGSSFPGTPSAGELFWRTDEATLYRRNDANDAWEGISSSGSGTDPNLVVENGFDSSGTDSGTTITFTDGTRTLAITPTGADFTFWSNGTSYTKSAQETIQISDVEGLHFIYYNSSGVLTETTTFAATLITSECLVAIVYWDATNNESVIFADERHGRTMDSATHLLLHQSFGAQYVSGLGLGNLVVGGDGNTDSHAQFSVSNGVIYDEDIRIDIDDGSPQELDPIAQIPLLYRSGASGEWRKVAATNFPITTTGTGRAAWNEWTGATWQLTEVGNNDYVLVHYFASNDTRHPIIGVVGQANYATRGDAEAGAPTEIKDLAFGQLDSLLPEFRAIATVIFQTGDGKSNTVKSSVEETENGNDYVDWRTSTIGSGSAGGGTGVSDHGNLSGLGDDDHTQYHNDTRGDARYYQQSEFLNASAGAGDAGKPVVLDAAGEINSTMMPAHASQHLSGGDDPIAHDSLSGAGTNTHAQVDSHIASTANPHGVTATQVSAVPTSDVGAANGVAPLNASSKIETTYLPDSVLGTLQYQGAWNASTNTPSLSSGSGTQGHYYVVSAAGTTSLDGISDWEVGDWAVYNGSAWEKIDNSDKVSSVNGATGAVVLDETDVGAAAATHASQHLSGGADSIKLDDLAAPDDNTDLNASASAHGLLPKLSNVATEFLNGQGSWATPAGGSTPSDSPAIDVLNNSTQVIDSGIYIEWDTEREKSSEFTHSTTVDPEVIEIATAGKYLVSVNVTTDGTLGTSRSASLGWVELDTGGGYAEIDGSRWATYCRQASQGRSTASVTMVLDLAVGDKIRVYATRDSGTTSISTYANGCRCVIVGMQGPAGADGADGATGATGAGSNIIVQDDGVTVGTVMDTVNFGTGLTVTNDGSGDCTVDAAGGGGIEEHSAWDATDNSTSSGTYQDALTLTFTPGSASDDWEIVWSYAARIADSTEYALMRIEVDGTTYYGEQNPLLGDNSTDYLYSGYIRLNLTAASHTIKIQYRPQETYTSLTLRDCYLRARKLEG